jgi:Tfp pilus assembly protein PilN
MKAPNLHLNLLHASERQSSSPVRLRVMLPVLAVLACVGCLVWWGVLACQLMLVKSQTSALEEEIRAKNAEHGGIRSQMDSVRNAQAELDQLTMYAHGRRTYGNLFMNLANVVPEGLQLLSLEIPEPPVQNLLPPGAKPGPKVKPLLGPTGTVERVALRIVGRSPKEKPVEALMKSLEGPAFTNELVIAKGVPPNQASPRIRSFNQEDRSSVDGVRQLVFDVEYRCAERRFEK